MFWIYVPPIILVAALAGLVVVLGRKSKDLKRIKSLQPKPEIQMGSKSWKNRLGSLGRKFLHILEKLLSTTKTASKRMEQTTSVWAAKLRAKRNGKKLKAGIPPDYSPKLEEDGTEIIQKIEQSDEISANLERDDDLRYIGNEVIVRRKIIEQPIVVQKREPLPEDSVRESALIYRIAENPKDIEAYREIGDYYLETGNIKDAKESFKMVLKLRPRDLKAKSSLREIEMRMRLGS